MKLSKKVIIIVSVSFLLCNCSSKPKNKITYAALNQQWFDSKHSLLCTYTLLPPNKPRRFIAIAPEEIRECKERITINLTTDEVDWGPHNPFR